MVKSIREWLNENMVRYQSMENGRVLWQRDCAKELNVSEASVRTKAAGIWPLRRTTSFSLVSPSSATCEAEGLERDLIQPEVFLKEIDIVAKVMDFLNNVVKDAYMEDEKFRKRMKVSQSKWKEITALPQFSNRFYVYDYDGGKKKKVWSSEAGIRLASETVDMVRYQYG